MTADHPGTAALTLPGLLRRNTATYGDKPAIVTAETSLTHRQLDERSRALAARLVSAGIGKSSRVGLLLPNGADWVVLAASVMRMGAVLVPLSTLLRPPELRAQLRIAGVTELVVAREYRGRSYLADLESIAPGVAAHIAGDRRHPGLPALRRLWPIDEPPPAAVDEAMVGALEEVVRPADDLAVLFTSGSRGAPKGVVHTHGGALRAVAAGLDARCVGSDDRLYIPMPFFWTGGFGAGILTALVAGATLITEPDPEPGRTLELLERERVTLFRGWPDQATRLAADPRFAKAELGSLRPGSLPGVLPARRRPAPGARANLFGMTETCGPYAGERLDTDLPPAKRGSCGRPFEGVEVRIVDPDTGAACPPGTTGEIRLGGPNVLRGVCGRLREETFDPDGFYPTGDLGSLDADGYLWFHGRLDDMFKVKGATVYPAEVEAALGDVDGVRQAFVTNLRHTDGTDAVGAFVWADSTADQLAEALRTRLSAFKVPSVWHVTTDPGELPLLASGKVDKRALQQLLERRGRRRDGGRGRLPAPGKRS